MGHDCPAKGGGVKKVTGAGLYDPAQGLGGFRYVRITNVNALEHAEVDCFVEALVQCIDQRLGPGAERRIATVFTQGIQTLRKFVTTAGPRRGHVAQIAQAAQNPMDRGLRQPAFLGQLCQTQGATGAGQHLEHRKGFV